MLFAEAGTLKAGQITGVRTPYQLGIEIVQMLETGVTGRTYTWYHMQQGNRDWPGPKANFSPQDVQDIIEWQKEP
jgi:hypothetical protein